MGTQIVSCLIVFSGGGLGAVMRYGLGAAAVRLWGVHFPYGTLLINALGSFLIGIVACYFMSLNHAPYQTLRLFLIVGILGGFTTFSSFSLEALTLLQRGDALLALGYVLSSVLISLSLVFCGYGLVKLSLG